MGVYVYCMREDYRYRSSMAGSEFENEWFSLYPDGTVLIKGTHYQGYAWDGCSPKIKIKDVYLGIPEGVLNFDTGKSKTYYGSLVHDVFYQFSRQLKTIVRRKAVDREFYAILKRDKFALAWLYYLAVRLLGWAFWYKS